MEYAWDEGAHWIHDFGDHHVFFDRGRSQQKERTRKKTDTINSFEKMEHKKINVFLYGKKWMSYIPVCIQIWQILP